MANVGEKTLEDNAEERVNTDQRRNSKDSLISFGQEQGNKDLQTGSKDRQSQASRVGATTSLDSSSWQLMGSTSRVSTTQVGRSGSVLSVQFEPESIAENTEEKAAENTEEKAEELNEVQKEMAAVLAQHLKKLQSLLETWTEEQISILKNGNAVSSGLYTRAAPRISDYPFLDSSDDQLRQSVRALSARNASSIRGSSVGIPPAAGRKSITPILQESDRTRMDTWRVSQKSSDGKKPVGKMVSLQVDEKDSLSAADCDSDDAKGRKSDAGKKSVLFDRHTSIESHVVDSVRNRSDQINAQLQRLNFARTSRTKQRSRILDESVPEASFRISRVLAPVVNSTKFDTLCSVVILLNACIMGISADYAISSPHDPDVSVLEFLEAVFCAYYTFEVAVRLLVQGCDYFCGYGCSWNWFDLALVVHSLYDQIQTRLAAELNDGGVNNLSFLRLLRLMKMLRLLRIIRLMKMFKELRMMLFSMLGSMKAMVWACVFIAMISYMFGICVLQGCTLYLQGGGTEKADQIRIYWGSIGTAMLSLFKSSTAGQNWAEIARPLEEVGFFFYALFVLYVAFFAFVVVNTLTSIFVEVTMENSEKDNQMVIQLELEKKNMYMTRLQAFYDEINNDENGCISYEDFCQHLQNPKMMAFAASLDLDILNAKQFFFMLSENGTRPVDVETFVVGCIKLKGLAKNMDLMDLIYTFKKNQTEQKAHGAFVREQFEGMKQILTDARFTKRLDKIEASLSRLQCSLGVEEPQMDPSRGEQSSRKSLVL